MNGIRDRVYKELWDEADNHSLFQCPNCNDGDIDISEADEGYSLNCWSCNNIEVYPPGQLMEAIAVGKK